MFTTIKSRGPQERQLCQTYGQIRGCCPRPIKGHPPRGQDPVDGRGPMTETVLQPKIGAMDLKPSNLLFMKAHAFQGKRKIKDRWEDKPHEVVHQIMRDVSSYNVMD